MREQTAGAELDGLTARQREQLQRFTVELRASPHNLLSSRALEELWSRHVPECAALGARIPEGARVADLGSGGGFPGVVIAITRPDTDVVLIESTGKKARFLRQVASRLGLDIEVVNERAEELGGSRWAGSFDAVTARAVAPLTQLIPWSLPLLRPGGRLYAVKGRSWREDLREARDRLGGAGSGSFRVVETPDERERRRPAEPRVVLVAPGQDERP